MQERENTARIRIDELQGLLETTSTEQRITARMPAMTLEHLLEPEPPPPEIQVTFRRTPRATEIPPLPAPADDDFDGEESASFDPLDQVRDTVRMSAAAALAGVHDLGRASVIGTINGVPVHACGPDLAALIQHSIEHAQAHAVDAVIDAAVDAAIDAEIHNAEIEAAIDAVTLPTPTALEPKRYGIVALAFALSFAAGILAMFLLS